MRSHLSEDRYQDAEDPFGKSVDALELIGGWRVKRLLWTVLVAIVRDLCILAIVTLLGGGINTGLAVGSYWTIKISLRSIDGANRHRSLRISTAKPRLELTDWIKVFCHATVHDVYVVSVFKVQAYDSYVGAVGG